MKKVAETEVYFYSNFEDDYLLEAIFPVFENEEGRCFVSNAFVNLIEKYNFAGQKFIFKHQAIESEEK